MVDSQSIFRLVDDLVNGRFGSHQSVLSERLNGYYRWSALPALEDKVAEWSKEHPLIWNIGIGPSASFVQTLTRLLFERTKSIYGPYDHIVRVRHTPTMPAGSGTAQHWLAIEALMEIATTIHIPLPESEYNTKLEELKQHIAEETYFGYGALSGHLMLQAFGRDYIFYFGTDWTVLWDPSFECQPQWSQVYRKVREALQGKRHLLVVENMHVPVSLDVLVFTTNLRPSIYQQNRWLISTNSKDVCDKSRMTKGSTTSSRMTKGAPPFGDLDLDKLEWSKLNQRAEAHLQTNSLNRMRIAQKLWEHLSPEYYHAPPFDDLHQREWTMLIKEAIQDAAGSIHNTLQHQGRDIKFWLHIAQHCFYYGILYHPLQGDAPSSVSSDELVRCWVAEDLLFSTRSPTNIPAATSNNKQSNYYRSAYETGKVIIQALQEYSLLPIYSVSTTPTTSSTSGTATTSSSHDAITGVSKVAEGVPKLQQDELGDHVKSSRLRWVSFMNDDGRHINWDWRYSPKSITGEMMMTTLILRGCSKISGFPFNKVLNKHLRVLDLSYTPINCLPSGFSQLLNLHLLYLRGCFQLETLSSTPTASEEQETAPLAHLGNLEVLDMNGVPLLQITQEDGSKKTNLHFLDLTDSRVTTLPSEFFHSMSSLEELILGNCCNLKELPPSMAELSNLLVLHIQGTQINSFPEDLFQALQRLHTLKLISNKLLMSFPRSLSEAKGLKELHIYNCCRLRLQFLWELVSGLEDLYIKTWKSLEDIKIEGHPKLRTFSLSGPWIRCLSLHGCSSLKIVNISDDLTALEDVDLSGTALEEVPHNLPNLPQLNRLLLLNVTCFKRFPWHQLVRFPRVFYLDNCDDNQFLKMFCKNEIFAGENQHSQKTMNTAQININDSRLFHSFNSYAANKLQRFNVQVKPCIVRGMQPKKNDDEIYTNKQRQSPYPDIHSSEADSIVHMMELQPKERHVEISAKNRYPDGLRHLLSVAKSIFITDDCFIRCLTELNYEMLCLQECQLIHCHAMEVVFQMNSRSRGERIYVKGKRIPMPEVFPSLQTLQVSNLNKLVSLVEPGNLTYSRLITLKLLRYIHLEHCQCLEKVFPCSLSLPALETLVILFCCNLKTLFYKEPKYDLAPSPVPNIKRIYLQELPQLQHFHDDVTFQFETPKWEKLFVRGCHSLNRLPLLKSKYQKSKVEVSGERDWWGRLHWSLGEQSHYYLHVPPPTFVSRQKHIIRSYLM